MHNKIKCHKEDETVQEDEALATHHSSKIKKQQMKEPHLIVSVILLYPQHNTEKQRSTQLSSLKHPIPNGTQDVGFLNRQCTQTLFFFQITSLPSLFPLQMLLHRYLYFIFLRILPLIFLIDFLNVETEETEA